MKSLILVFSLIFSHLAVQACDENIRQFPRDCAIQDRYVALKNAYAAKQINIDEIAEYRVIRFVDRYNWERAKRSEVLPENIYQPSPDTWVVWDSGIREIMKTAGGKASLFQGYILNEKSISDINKNLLTNEKLHMNTKDKITDQTLQPGEYRKATSSAVGFFSGGANYATAIARSEESMNRFQQKFEAAVGASFSDLLKEAGVANYAGANFRSGMVDDSVRQFVSYAPSAVVATELEWIKTFIQLNLERYKASNPALSPIELAAVVQKWFVSLHPFSDGNGRTSRAIQDIILANFDMPFIPGGDLQEDATAVYENYLETTYVKTEAMLATLELCQTYNANAFQCRTINQLSVAPVKPEAVNFEKATRKKD